MSENTIKLKPASDKVLVRDPDTFQPLSQKGEFKPRNSYWLRRLSDGDVVDCDKKTKEIAK